MAGGNAELQQPPVVHFHRGDQTSVGERIDRIQQRMAEDIVVGRQLGLNPWHGDEPAHSQIQALCNPRNINIDVFQRGIKPILPLMVQPRTAKVSFCDRVAIVRSEQSG